MTRQATEKEPGVRAAFTLIEVLAAVFLTAVVMSVAIAFSVNLNDASEAAAAKARQGRHALAILDRVARDLEGAYLISKPAELDPLLHAWIFVADSQEGDEASDRLQFVTRSYRPPNPLDHGSDLAMVTYLLHPADEAAGFDLLRSVSPGLSADPAGEFPLASDERFMVVAEGIDYFGIRFMSADFEWFDAWDSTQLAQSDGLPRAATIEIAFLAEQPPDADPFEDFGRIDAEEGDTPLYARQVRLPMEAIDLNAILAAGLADKGVPSEGDDFGDEEDLDEDFEEEDNDSDSNPTETSAPGSGSQGIPDDLEGLGLPPGITREQIESLIP